MLISSRHTSQNSAERFFFYRLQSEETKLKAFD